MTAIEAYVLAKKIALGAVSGIKNITLSPTGQLVFVFNDGSSANWQIPLPQDGVDGLSITDVEINANKHLICTMSDGSTIDAGELPGGGGLVQVSNFSSLPTTGDKSTLYLTLDDDSLYYWNNSYKTISSSGGSAGDFASGSIEFDGIEQTFALPINNKNINVYVNGMFLTENEDYTLDKTVSPNTITFLETWDKTDLCTLIWVKGGSGGEDLPDISLATKEDILSLFQEGDNG